MRHPAPYRRTYNRRIEKAGNDEAIRYVYDGGNVIAEYDGNGGLLCKYIYGPRVDEPVCMINVADNNAVSYYHFDGLGSVVALSDSDGDSVQSYEYSIYGQVAAEDPNHTNPYMFTGRRFDFETGLYYYRARYYNPYIGRFLQTDPIGYEDSLNMYTYCLNSPINAIDPSGCFSTTFMMRMVVRAGNILIRRALASIGIEGQRLEGWEEALTLFSMWVNETTDEVILCKGRGNAFVKELMYSAPIGAARAEFYEKNYGKPLSEWQAVLYDEYDFGLTQLFTPEDSLNPALHFLGSFDVVITPRTTDDGEDTISITEDVTWESFWRIVDAFGFPLQYRLISYFKMIDDMTVKIKWTEHVAAPPTPSTESVDIIHLQN